MGDSSTHLNNNTELMAMSSISRQLDEVQDEAMRARILNWVMDKYGKSGSTNPVLNNTDSKDEDDTYGSFVDLYDKVNPQDRITRGLTAGYWLQVVGGSDSWNSHAVNKLLKDLGFGIDGISKVFVAAQKQQPALVRQVSKGGRTQQAKKTYKLTQAGINVIKALL